MRFTTATLKKMDAAASPLRARRLGGGWRKVARKEFTDHLLSVRFYILLGLMALAGSAVVYSVAGALRSVSEGITEQAPGLFLKLYTVNPAANLPPFLSLVALLGPLLGIAFGFDAVNGERSQGTLPRLLSQPIHRDDVINGKFVAGLAVISMVLVALTAFVGAVGIVRTGIHPSLTDFVRLLIYLVVTIVYIGFWLALSVLFSVVLRKAATSALAAISAWLVATLFAFVFVGLVANVVSPVSDESPTIEEQIQNAKTQRTISFVFPQAVYEEATVAVLEPEARTFDGLAFLRLQDASSRAIPSPLSLEGSLSVVWRQVFALIAMTVVCFAIAYVNFMKQEVRA